MSEQKSKYSGLLNAIGEWSESILIALVLAIFIRTYFLQPFKIPSGSMRMTLVEGDHLFVSKINYGPILLPEIHSPEFLKKIVDVQWPEFVTPLTKIRLPGLGKPKRGDVIVFVYPADRSKDFIKRLIGLPGDVVEIREGRIIINGQLVTEAPISKLYYYNRGDYGAAGQPIKVPEGKYFVLGDNSGASHDSRYWGFVDEKDIVGKAQVIFWPILRVRFIQ